jgi:hypothetical protein
LGEGKEQATMELLKQFETTLTLVNSNKGGLQPHAESLVGLAEEAFTGGHRAVARRIVEYYLQRAPQKDQYYVRASVLLGLVLDNEAKATNGSESIRRRKHALSQMIAALDVATAPENASRYAFLVFNTSVACWRVLRPYIRAGRGRFFVNEASQVSAALEKCDDRDIEWRISYLSATALCYADAGQVKPAEESMDKAIGHAEKLLAACMEKEKAIMVEVKAAGAEMEEATAAYRKLEEKEEAFHNKKKKIDPDAEDDLPSEEAKAAAAAAEAAAEAADPSERVSAEEFEAAKTRKAAAMARKTRVEDRLRSNNEVKAAKQTLLTRLYMQRVNTNPADAKKIAGLPGASQTLRMRALVQLQCAAAGCIDAKDLPTTFAGLIKDLTANDKQPLSPALQVETLLDVCRVAWQMDMKDAAVGAYDAATAVTINPIPVLRVKLDLCKALSIVAESATENPNLILVARLTAREAEGYVVNRRIEAVRLLERVIPSCQARVKDNILLQEVCVAVWNAALPLLQPHLRKHVYRALQVPSSSFASHHHLSLPDLPPSHPLRATLPVPRQLVARALEDADSPLVQLRVQVHLELAKCEEQADFVGKAKEEADKAEAVDYGALLDEQALLAEAAAAGGSKGADASKKAPPPDKKGAPAAAAAAVAAPAEGAAEGESEELDRARPLDHIIRPMMEVLGLRVSVYDQVRSTPLPCRRSFPRAFAPASQVVYRPSRSPLVCCSRRTWRGRCCCCCSRRRKAPRCRSRPTHSSRYLLNRYLSGPYTYIDPYLGPYLGHI